MTMVICYGILMLKLTIPRDCLWLPLYCPVMHRLCKQWLSNLLHTASVFPLRLHTANPVFCTSSKFYFVLDICITVACMRMSMRLLTLTANDELNLTTFTDEESLPPYAILSHTWIENQEVVYDELVAGTGKEKVGYDKLRFCGERAAQDGLQYIWVGTCCIDKRNNTELGTAIRGTSRSIRYEGKTSLLRSTSRLLRV
jgi:hypothetical protein